MTVRSAEKNDFPAIRALFWQLDADAIRSQPEHFQRGERMDEYLMGIIENEKSVFLLACADDKVIGFSLIYEKEVKGLSLLVPCRYGYIQDFVIDEGYRGQGFGRELFCASKKWAKEHGLDYLRLSVLPDNDNARRFYARNGLREQMITMVCPLDE